ncbi:MAG: hypothetical protein H7A43_05940 [Verrucomicrobia bacterium]|nr:hypothetical protein [Verrucomicrobiota bacterium]
MIFLAGSACVYFSEFNKQIPLLAPFLAVPGVWALIAGAWRLRQFDWTIIRKKNGDRALFILHSKSNCSELENFEKRFAQAVNEYRQENDNANRVPVTD